MKLNDLRGAAYDEVFREEVSKFKAGKTGDDVRAAIILRDSGKMDLLRLLHKREIRVVVDVDEDTRLGDLRFEILP